MLTAELRDTAVARLELPQNNYSPGFARTVVAKRPGKTVLVFRRQQRADSVSVEVIDTIPMGSVASVATGTVTSCAITEANALHCWGVPLKQRPFNETTTCFGAPCDPTPVPAAGNVRSVHIGMNRWCIIGTDDAVVCSDTTGVPGSVAFRTLAHGWSHSCGLNSEGKAYCWGKAQAGLFGNAPGAPEVGGGHRWVSIAAIEDRTCGVTDAWQLYCWGILATPGASVPGAAVCTRTFTEKNGGTSTTSYPCGINPVRMTLTLQGGTDTTFADVSDRCARTVSGRVFCHEPTTGRFVERAGIGPFRSIATGSSFGCGLDAAGSAWCWGENFYGQLGNGTTTSSQSAVKVAASHSFRQLSAGSAHVCGVTVASDVWCWGANHVGQAGAPILTKPLSPVRVRGQK